MVKEIGPVTQIAQNSSPFFRSKVPMTRFDGVTRHKPVEHPGPCFPPQVFENDTAEPASRAIEAQEHTAGRRFHGIDKPAQLVVGHNMRLLDVNVLLTIQGLDGVLSM